jgi:hypothetical protein
LGCSAAFALGFVFGLDTGFGFAGCFGFALASSSRRQLFRS